MTTSTEMLLSPPGRLHLVQTTLPTVGVGGTGAVIAVDVGVANGLLTRMDVAIVPAQDAVITLSVFTKAGAVAGDVNTLVECRDVTGDFHPTLFQRFVNLDSPPSTLLYFQAVHTGGTEETGVIAINIWIET